MAIRPGTVVDACAFPAWPSTPTLTHYMDEPWQRMLLRPGDRSGPATVLSPRLYVDPRRRAPVADPDAFAAELLDDGVRERVVLGWDDGLFSTIFPYPYVARKVVRAANEWLAEEWLSRDDRFHGMVLVSSQLPEDAAAEIRRAGEDDRFAAVAIGGNGLGRPFGAPNYVPIFEAAAEMGLPVVLQLGSDSSTDQLAPPVAGGLPATYAEYRVLAVHAHMSHLASLILQGIFERLPRLQILLFGGGIGWVPAWLWRLDYWVRRNRNQAPWMERLPSDYFPDHVRLATHGLEAPRDPSRMHHLLDSIPRFAETVLYASGLPTVDAEEPDAVVARLPASWQDGALRENALRFFRWPGSPAGDPGGPHAAAAPSGTGG